MTEVALRDEDVERFFAFARERHAVYLRRKRGDPRPWTKDPILGEYSITNVYRELDKTTQWFRKYVRDPYSNLPEVMAATVLFRWFNTIRSGETIFLQPALIGDAQRAAGGSQTPWEAYLATGDLDALRGPLRRQGAPWVTGAYMIRSPEGMDKLDGVLQSFHEFYTSQQPFQFTHGTTRGTWRDVAQECLNRRISGAPRTLEQVWEWLLGYYGLGKFLAYEIVTDLRHTSLLDLAPDINTWANPGPGALRGANLLIRGPVRVRKGRLEKCSYPEAHATMARLLELSRDPLFWPQPQLNGTVEAGMDYAIGEKERFGDLGDVLLKAEDWPKWEMREPEMWLCEYAKYERTRLGYGRPRGKYP
jgi:hypothetical protein